VWCSRWRSFSNLAQQDNFNFSSLLLRCVDRSAFCGAPFPPKFPHPLFTAFRVPPVLLIPQFDAWFSPHHRLLWHPAIFYFFAFHIVEGKAFSVDLASRPRRRCMNVLFMSPSVLLPSALCGGNFTPCPFDLGANFDLGPIPRSAFVGPEFFSPPLFEICPCLPGVQRGKKVYPLTVLSSLIAVQEPTSPHSSFQSRVFTPSQLGHFSFAQARTTGPDIHKSRRLLIFPNGCAC